jgi:excisionase family DNA binding protein
MDAIRVMGNTSRVVPLRPTWDVDPIAVQPCWTVPELAAYLQVSRRTITTWIHQGRIRAHRLSSTVTVIEPREVERFLAAHETGRR